MARRVVSFCAMRPGVLVALATVVALVVAPSAAAGLEAHLSVRPSVVNIGGVVQIELRTFAVQGSIRRLDDGSGSRLRVEVVSPENRVVRLGLRHVARGVWRAAYRFREAGKWQVRVANWPKPGHGPHLSLTVREPAEAPPATNP
jgi:hypothetical protein